MTRAAGVLGGALATLLLLADAAPAQGRKLGLTPIFIRITGYLGAKRDKPILLTSWNVNRGRDVYAWRVIKLEVLSGNIAYFNIVEQLEPYDPAFNIAGDTRGIDTFIATPPGEIFTVMGYLRFDGGFRTLMIDTVARPAAETPPPN